MAILNIGLSAVATGTANVITATYSPAITLSDKRIVFLKITTPNTITAPTFNPNGLGAQTITKNNGDPLEVNDLQGDVVLKYDLANTNWELLTPKSSFNSPNTLSRINVTDTTALAQVSNVGGDYTQLQVRDTDISIYAEDTSFNTSSVTVEPLEITIDSPSITLTQNTASRVLVTDASKRLKASSTTATQLSYLDATSSIQTQLNAKLTSANIVETITNGVTDKAPSENAVFDALALKLGFCLQGCGNAVTLADSTTYYMADANIGTLAATSGVQRIYVPKACTLKKVVVYSRVAGTLGSNENVEVYVRQNNTTDLTVTITGQYTASTNIFTQTFTTAFAEDDFFEIKVVVPTMATNPTSVSHTFVLYFE